MIPCHCRIGRFWTLIGPITSATACIRQAKRVVIVLSPLTVLFRTERSKDIGGVVRSVIRHEKSWR